MEDKCAQTLEALEVFITAQNALLARTQKDITRLRDLKTEIIQEPSNVSLDFFSKLDDSAFRLSDQSDCGLTLPNCLDWSIFETRDPTPLKDFALNIRRQRIERNRPHLKQLSELSDLQKLVKNARTTIVDPVLSQFADMSEPEEENDDLEASPEEIRREREREKIRELKKHKIRAGLSLPSNQSQIAAGVFIRHDVEDESMEVEISHDEKDSRGTGCTDTTIVTGPISSAVVTAKHRSRRVSTKIKESEFAVVPRKRSKKSDILTPDDPLPKSGPPDSEQIVDEKKVSKPKPETYKQAWSVSEQHLLEQLLEQIPEGEKFRWQKISRAMNGRRTPRQVASRVQKYFEKLKRFGVGFGGSSSAAP